jgi:glycine cleavage system H lipoate-binding protein
MVFVLVLLTVLTFLAVDLILRKEDRVIKNAGKSKKSPIFLSPEKSLQPLKMEDAKLYHLSHSWAVAAGEGYAYIGYDNFISSLFSSDVKLKDLPLVGTHVPQGIKIWEVKHNGHKIDQLSPISGEVVAVNAACCADVPLPSEKVEKSWIIKMKTDRIESETNNLMKHDQAAVLNSALRDELVQMVHDGKYLNDGGKIDPAYMNNISNEDWENLIHKFFPYQQSM